MCLHGTDDLGITIIEMWGTILPVGTRQLPRKHEFSKFPLMCLHGTEDEGITIFEMWGTSSPVGTRQLPRKHKLSKFLLLEVWL